MNKLPAGEIIASSYRFLFGHIGTVLAITWLPAVLYAAADYAAHIYLAMHRTELEAGDARAQGLYFAVIAAVFFVRVFASAVAAAGIVREVFGWRVETVIHFPLDGTVWRIFAASIRFWIGSAALIALAFGIAALGSLLAGVSPNATPEQVPVTPAGLVASVLALGTLVYALATMLRVGFLLPAVVVAEEKGGLKRSHDLTAGNFWHVFVLAFALVLPAVVLLVSGEMTVLGAAIGADTPEQGDLARLMQRAEDAVYQRLAPWEIFNGVVFILYSGLTYSGVANAYRALAGKGATRPGDRLQSP